MKTSALRRLMSLDERIRSGRYPNCRSFSREYEVSRRTVARDIEYLLNTLLAPVKFDVARNGYFYEENWAMPALVASVSYADEPVETAIRLLRSMSYTDRSKVLSAFAAPPARTSTPVERRDVAAADASRTPEAAGPGGAMRGYYFTEPATAEIQPEAVTDGHPQRG